MDLILCLLVRLQLRLVSCGLGRNKSPEGAGKAVAVSSALRCDSKRSVIAAGHLVYMSPAKL